ncbi:class I SAM-dependent methyltransferase [Mucilaginibacter mali]|uniref:Class I SAM-dependent methyltransferase n=1 Tax=Mucilaginibacter mali TaxID=2740462 RepID=A0A7D4Q828_9SPHI|nr:class I SAM-dependent methyltransferase [Mucilaginibacter mali]QKJ30431.1 class I SAM-dependent methyltransferase [Mucilaginibacter mali]
MNIVPQEYWDAGYENIAIRKASDTDPISQVIRAYIPPAQPNGHAFEIGCYPAQFLCVLGDMGYTLNGVDATPRVAALPVALANLGYTTGKFENNRFEDLDKVKYDVVASFGFIEHFTNWPAVIKAHTEFLKPGGYLIITTPNFKGLFQYLYHRLVDNPNLERHVVSSMSPRKWKKQLERAGMTVIASGYTGNFFWDEAQRNSIFYRVVKRAFTRIFKLVNSIAPNHPSIGSYCYIVAKSK